MHKIRLFSHNPLPTIAIVTREIPEPDRAGHLSYMYEILKRLQSLEYNVAIILVEELDFRRRDYSELYRPGQTMILGRDVFALSCRVFVKSQYKAWLDEWKDRLREKMQSAILSKFFSRRARPVDPESIQTTEQKKTNLDETIGQFVTSEDAEHVAHILDKLRPSIVLFDTIFLSKILDFLHTEIHSMVITHDVFYRRCQSYHEKGYRVTPQGFTRDREAALLSKFDAIIAIQDDEARELREMVSSREVITVGMPVTFTSTDRKLRSKGRFVFVGSWGLTNADGLRWFLERVWPAVRQAIPYAEFHIHGSVCGMLEGSASRGVVFHGFTSDLSVAYRNATFAIAPLTIGSGLKIKILEYLSFGLPCVTTTIGSAGFRSSPKAPLLVADDEAAFAAHCIRLCEDEFLLHELQNHAEEYVQNYNPTEVFMQLDQYLARAKGKTALA